MSTVQDFERIWDSVEAVISGTLIDASDIFNELNEAWTFEQKKWRDPTRLQYNFWLTLNKKNPALAKEFIATIEKFSFRKADLPTSPSLAPYVFGTLCFAAAGAALAYILPEDSFLPRLIGHIPSIILGGMVFAWTGGGIFIGLRKNKTKILRKRAVNAYLKQFKPLRENLIEVCKKIDET